MSVQATSWVWSNSKTTGTAKLVLLAIADHSWPDGTNAWPSVARLSRMTGLSEDTVRRSVRKAESLGELVVVRKSGGRARSGEHASNDYDLVMASNTPSGTPPPQSQEKLKVKAATAEKNSSSPEADSVCREWWDSCDPKPMPAGGFVGARKIIGKALDAGWRPDELAKALPQVETLAFWSLEKALKQNRQQLVPQGDKAWW